MAWASVQALADIKHLTSVMHVLLFHALNITQQCCKEDAFMQDDAEAEDLEDDFLGARLDPFALLQNMAAQNENVGTQAAIQPYEILAKQARQARQKAAPAKSPKRKAQDPLDGSSEVSISHSSILSDSSLWPWQHTYTSSV